MRSLDIRRALSKQGECFVGITEHHMQFDAYDTPVFTLLDCLYVLPARPRLFARRWPPDSLVCGHLTIYLEHRVVDPSPAIGDRRGRCVWMPPSLQGLEYLVRRFRLGLGDSSRDAQSSIHVEHGGTPELPAFVGFRIVFFSPLLPT